MVNLLGLNAEVQTNRDGGTEVGYIVSANQVGLYRMPGLVVFCPPLHLDIGHNFAHPALDVGKRIFP